MIFWAMFLVGKLFDGANETLGQLCTYVIEYYYMSWGVHNNECIVKYVGEIKQGACRTYMTIVKYVGQIKNIRRLVDYRSSLAFPSGASKVFVLKHKHILMFRYSVQITEIRMIVYEHERRLLHLHVLDSCDDFMSISNIKWASAWENQTNGMCAQQRTR